MRKTLLCALMMMTLAPTANAACLIKSPYETKGSYAENFFDFVAGYWISLRGERAIDFGESYRKRRALHTFRLVNPAQRVLGCPKTSLEDALTLGHEGYVIVGPRNCFRNGPGPDILVHEPRTDINTQESFNVYITADGKGKGPWHKVVTAKTVSTHNNFLEIDISGIKTARGYPLEEFVWVKIEDANSQVVLSNKHYSGFDVSAVKFLHPCKIDVSRNDRRSPSTPLGDTIELAARHTAEVKQTPDTAALPYNPLR